MKDPSDLNKTDRKILSQLGRGRETRGSLARNLDRHTNYIGERIGWLLDRGLVEYYDEDTALFQITEKGRVWHQEAVDE